MELNRKKAEELVRVSALEGQIVLTSLSPVRARSIEANPDGSVTRRRTLSSLVDYFMPLIEIDRVLRGFSYLDLKGRNLVRCKK